MYDTIVLFCCVTFLFTVVRLRAFFFFEKKCCLVVLIEFLSCIYRNCACSVLVLYRTVVVEIFVWTKMWWGFHVSYFLKSHNFFKCAIHHTDTHSLVVISRCTGLLVFLKRRLWVKICGLHTTSFFISVRYYIGTIPVSNLRYSTNYNYVNNLLTQVTNRIHLRTDVRTYVLHQNLVFGLVRY